jgi:hypothetical protein
MGRRAANSLSTPPVAPVPPIRRRLYPARRRVIAEQLNLNKFTLDGM